MDYQLSFAVDDRVPHARWIASLSDGKTVYENRIPDPNLRLSWMRLRNYLKDSKLSLTRLRFQAGNKTTNIPKADAYMVFHKLIKGLGPFEQHFACVGALTGEILHVWSFGPDGSLLLEEDRPCEKSHPALIFVEKTLL